MYLLELYKNAITIIFIISTDFREESETDKFINVSNTCGYCLYINKHHYDL